MKRFARDGIVAKKFFAGGGTTFSSFPTIHASRYFFFVDGVRPDPFVPTLAEVLAKNGFYNIGISSNMFMSKFFGVLYIILNIIIALQGYTEVKQMSKNEKKSEAFLFISKDGNDN